MAHVLGHHPILAALTLLLAGCGDTEPTSVRLLMTLGTCDVSQITHVDGVRVVLQMGSFQREECLAISPSTLDEFQSGLAKHLSFLGLEPASYRLTIRGYDHVGCQDTIHTCGSRSFELPGAEATVSIPVHCSDGTSPPSDFTDCLKQ